MAAERIIGVDFGTSTSVIRVKRYENGNPIGEKLEAKEVVFGDRALVPTVIMKKDDAESASYFGYEAQQGKKNFTYFHSFKMDLESSDPEKRAQARQLTESFFSFLAKQYRSQSEGGHLGNPDDKERTIVSYPVKWNEGTKNFMLKTAAKAGFPNVTGMDEAQAAIQAVIVMNAGHLQKHGLLKNGVGTNILLIDMGAGTTDLVLACYTPGNEAEVEVLNTWPKSGDIQFGGREIDHLLQKFFRQMLDEGDAEKIFDRIGTDKFKSWKEGSVSPALRQNDSIKDFAEFDNLAGFLGLDLDYCLDRTAFESCLADYLRQFPQLINGCLQNAGMTGNDVDLVIVTGGHSQWYFVRDMLEGKMPQFEEVDLPKIKENPSRIIPISRPQETVALGLAYNGIHDTGEDELVVPEPPTPPGPDPIEDRISTPTFTMEIRQIISKPEGFVVEGTISLGEVVAGDAVYIWDATGKKCRSATIKRIGLCSKNNGTTIKDAAAENDVVAVRLDGIMATELSQGMILFKDTEEFRHAPLQWVQQSVERWKARQPVVPGPDDGDDTYTPESEFEIGSVGGTDCSIKKYLGNRTVVKIPPTIRGRKVVSIDTLAFGCIIIFQANRTIEKVIIPETVRTIGYCAFNVCSKLKVVIAHKNIESIGAEAFFGCNSLIKMDFGMGDCAEGHVILPPNLKSIGASAFLKNDLLCTCIFKEAQMSKQTKVKNMPGLKNFNPRYCAVFFYD